MAKRTNLAVLALVLAFLGTGTETLGNSAATDNQDGSASKKPSPKPNSARPKTPNYQNLRYEEDWSVLRKSQSRQRWDVPKYAPLTKDGTLYMSFGGQLRLRGESWDSFGFGGPGIRKDAFGLMRVRLHGDFFFGPHFRLFLEGKSSLATGRKLPGGNRTLDTDSAALQNAFIDFKAPLEGGSSLTFRAGRQELQFGAQRLVSPLDWSNTRLQVFDGFRGILKVGSWRVDGFWTKLIRTRKYHYNAHDSGTEFFGIYASRKIPDVRLSWDVYWLGIHRDRASFGNSTASERRHTIGTLIAGKRSSGLDFNFETAYQFGDHGNRDIRAYMLASQMGYGFLGLRAAPRLYVGFDYASGDGDPNDGELNTFNQLYPLGHAYLGFIDAIGRQNIMDFSQGFSFKPTTKFAIKIDHHMFWRARKLDALYNAGAGVLRRGGPGTSKGVGSELDLTLSLRLDRHILTTLGYSRFFAGSFIEESGSSQDINFGYLALQYTF